MLDPSVYPAHLSFSQTLLPRRVFPSRFFLPLSTRSHHQFRALSTLPCKLFAFGKLTSPPLPSRSPTLFRVVLTPRHSHSLPSPPMPRPGPLSYPLPFGTPARPEASITHVLMLPLRPRLAGATFDFSTSLLHFFTPIALHSPLRLASPFTRQHSDRTRRYWQGISTRTPLITSLFAPPLHLSFLVAPFFPFSGIAAPTVPSPTRPVYAVPPFVRRRVVGRAS